MAKDAGQLLGRGGPEPGGLQKRPCSSEHSGDSGRTSRVVLVLTENHTFPEHLPCVAGSALHASEMLPGQSENISGSKALHSQPAVSLKPPPLRALLEFKFNPILGLFL